MPTHLFPAFLFSATSIAAILTIPPLSATVVPTLRPCRSYCGNLTVDYPFALRPGCGHPGFRDLLFCINDVLMLHLPSGSYRVLDIDYAYATATLHDPHMSTCRAIFLGGRGNGLEIEPWRAPYLSPAPDDVFLLIGCSAQSPLFQGLPGGRSACRNGAGMDCNAYYGCPAWEAIGRRQAGNSDYGSGPPECCALPFELLRAVNLSRLRCEGYSSAYALAPLRAADALQWSYGIRVKYSVGGSAAFCRACEATGGGCGYVGGEAFRELCLCGSWNSSTTCDTSENSTSGGSGVSPATLKGMLIYMILRWMAKPALAEHAVAKMEKMKLQC